MTGDSLVRTVQTPTQIEIATRLRTLAIEMDDIAVCMDYYGGFAEWAQRGREMPSMSKITPNARQPAE